MVGLSPTIQSRIGVTPPYMRTFVDGYSGLAAMLVVLIGAYIAGGMGWKADYVALFDDVTSKLDVQGWITLTNGSAEGTDPAWARSIARDARLNR